MKKILATLALMLTGLCLFAQNISVSVRLKDSTSGEPVGFATVSLSPEKGSTKYALTDHDGKATVEKLRPGNYTFKAEIMGYKPLTKAVKVESENIDLGELTMDLDQEVLDAAKVSATGN